MKLATKLAVRPQFDIDAFIQTEADQVEWLLHCAVLLRRRHYSSLILMCFFCFSGVSEKWEIPTTQIVENNVSSINS